MVEESDDVSLNGSGLGDRVGATDRDTSTNRDCLNLPDEASLLQESNDIKSQANAQFAKGSYSDAISTYDRALAVCPSYLDYDIAVLKANIAACHIKFADWNVAAESASQCLDRLQNLTSSLESPSDSVGVKESPPIPSSPVTATIPSTQSGGKEREQMLAKIQRIRSKALLRRAKARTELGGWGQLDGALADYRELASMSNLTSLDRSTVETALQSLPLRLDQAKQKEMSDMVGKLKDLGNGILKPFGLSTDNFQFTQDEKSGGYNMQFVQGNK